MVGKAPLPYAETTMLAASATRQPPCADNANCVPLTDATGVGQTELLIAPGTGRDADVIRHLRPAEDNNPVMLVDVMADMT